MGSFFIIHHRNFSFCSALDKLSEFSKFFNDPVVNFTAELVSTSQCVKAYRSSKKKQKLSIIPSPFGDPSSDAVLQADKMTILALSFNFSISEIVKIPSFSTVDFSGGVKIKLWFRNVIRVATTACVANTIYL